MFLSCSATTFFSLKANFSCCEVKEIYNNYEEGNLHRAFFILSTSWGQASGCDLSPLRPMSLIRILTGVELSSNRAMQMCGRVKSQKVTALRTEEPVTPDPTWVCFYDFHILEVI